MKKDRDIKLTKRRKRLVESVEEFWLNKADKYSALHSSEYLRHSISKLIDKKRAKYILDYGCGDGRLIKYLKNNYDISVFDPSPKMLDLSRRNYGSRINKSYLKKSMLPNNYFDVVICCLVLMTIRRRKEFIKTIENLYRTTNEEGIVLLTITHPCFRMMKFSEFDTWYTNNKPFNYFAEGDPFKVTIFDRKLNKSVSFLNFHWSMSFTLNAISKAGFQFLKMIEVKDSAGKKRSNNRVPPFVTIVAKKS